mgnify:CR=1 FL=1
MKIQYDENADAIYFRLDQSDILESEEIRPGIIMDFNADDEVVGIELLGVKKRVSQSDLKQMQFEIA